MNPLPHQGSTISGMPTSLGFYDYVEIKKLDNFDSLLDSKWPSPHDDTLTRKISLIESETSGLTLDNYLNGKITFVCMAKLNSRTFFSDSTAKNSSEALEEIKQLIDNAVAQYRMDSNFTIKVAWTLSVYDVALLIQHNNPNTMAEAFLHIKQKVHKLAFSTSFFVVDFSSMMNYKDLYDKTKPQGIEVNVNVRMKFTTKQTAKLDKIKDCLKQELSIVRNEDLFIGYTPGDTDVVFAARNVSLLNALTLYNKLNDNNAPKEITDVVKHLQSSFSLFNPSDEYIIDQSAETNATKQRDEGWKRYTSVTNIYDEMKSKKTLPRICYNTIDNILLAFEYLYNFREHHDAALKFISLLEMGLEAHKKHLVDSTESTARPAIIDFVHDLNLSLRSIASAGTIYMDRMLELHPMNPYSKLFFSFEHIAKCIYDVLPHSETANKFEAFLTMSKKMAFNSTHHFITTLNDVSLVAIDVPHPQFFSLKDSFLPLLHEVAHYCVGGVRKETALKDIVLNYIAIEVCADKYGRTRNIYHPAEQNQVFSSLNELYAQAFLMLTGNYSRKPEIHDMLSYILGINAFEQGRLVEQRLDVPVEIFNVIKDFAFDDDYSFIRELSNVFDEAKADTLMLEMANDGSDEDKLCKYIEYLCTYFEESCINPLNGGNKQVFSFVRRCFFVFEFYEYTFEKLGNSTLINGTAKAMLTNLAQVEYAVYRFDILAKIFRQYMNSIVDGQNLHRNVIKKIMSNYTGKNLDQLDASEEVQLHIDSWYLGLKPE